MPKASELIMKKKIYIMAYQKKANSQQEDNAVNGLITKYRRPNMLKGLAWVVTPLNLCQKEDLVADWRLGSHY